MKALSVLYFGGRFLEKIRNFLNFGKFLGKFANLEVEERDVSALLGKIRGRKQKIDT